MLKVVLNTKPSNLFLVLTILQPMHHSYFNINYFGSHNRVSMDKVDLKGIVMH